MLQITNWLQQHNGYILVYFKTIINPYFCNFREKIQHFNPLSPLFAKTNALWLVIPSPKAFKWAQKAIKLWFVYSTFFFLFVNHSVQLLSKDPFLYEVWSYISAEQESFFKLNLKANEQMICEICRNIIASKRDSRFSSHWHWLDTIKYTLRFLKLTIQRVKTNKRSKSQSETRSFL